jgi:hypothetical protein
MLSRITGFVNLWYFLNVQKRIKCMRMLEEVFGYGGDVNSLAAPNVLKRPRTRVGAS